MNIRSSTSCRLPGCCHVRKPKKSKSHLLTLPIVWACRLLSVACHHQWDTRVPPACSGFGSPLISAPVCLYMSCACLNLNRCSGWSKGGKGNGSVRSGSLLCAEKPKTACREMERHDWTVLVDKRWVFSVEIIIFSSKSWIGEDFSKNKVNTHFDYLLYQ